MDTPEKAFQKIHGLRTALEAVLADTTYNSLLAQRCYIQGKRSDLRQRILYLLKRDFLLLSKEQVIRQKWNKNIRKEIAAFVSDVDKILQAIRQKKNGRDIIWLFDKDLSSGFRDRLPTIFRLVNGTEKVVPGIVDPVVSQIAPFLTDYKTDSTPFVVYELLRDIQKHLPENPEPWLAKMEPWIADTWRSITTCLDDLIGIVYRFIDRDRSPFWIFRIKLLKSARVRLFPIEDWMYLADVFFTDVKYFIHTEDPESKNRFLRMVAVIQLLKRWQQDRRTQEKIQEKITAPQGQEDWTPWIQAELGRLRRRHIETRGKEIPRGHKTTRATERVRQPVPRPQQQQQQHVLPQDARDELRDRILQRVGEIQDDVQDRVSRVRGRPDYPHLRRKQDNIRRVLNGMARTGTHILEMALRRDADVILLLDVKNIMRTLFPDSVPGQDRDRVASVDLRAVVERFVPSAEDVLAAVERDRSYAVWIDQGDLAEDPVVRIDAASAYLRISCADENGEDCYKAAVQQDRKNPMDDYVLLLLHDLFVRARTETERVLNEKEAGLLEDIRALEEAIRDRYEEGAGTDTLLGYAGQIRALKRSIRRLKNPVPEPVIVSGDRYRDFIRH